MGQINYKFFVTNQNRLAELANITPQHLSSIKAGTRKASKNTIDILSSITGIIPETWTDKTKKNQLKQHLKWFFIKQKQNEMLFLQSKRINHDT